MKILIMGLPGSGKSTFAKKLVEDLKELDKPAEWFNADSIREAVNDWDFSEQGRLRQVERMKRFAEGATTMGKIAVCDFVCPTHDLRKIFNADIVVWMDTISYSRYEDTNKLFEEPTYYDYRIKEKNSFPWTKVLADKV
jgi:adenylylsulfate kinase